MRDVEVPDVDYTQYTNRQLAAIPLAILAVALLILAGWYFWTGAPVSLGMDFTGGTEVRINTTDSPDEIRQTFADFDVSRVQPAGGDDIGVQENTVIVGVQENTSQAADRLQDTAESAGYVVQGIQSRSASFGESSQYQGIIGMSVAFIGMGLLVFGLFRTFVPSIAVIISAFSDIMIPLALMNVLGIKLTLGTVAALLMLIGYSVDSDLLLNNHVLRRRGGFYESAYRAMRTGVTMTLTSISAMVTMTIVATIFAIPLLPEIGLILVFGLTVDLMNTYMLNMSLLRWYKYEGVTR